jgi:hypothetical protein
MRLLLTILAVSFGFWGLIIFASKLSVNRLQRALLRNDIDEFDRISTGFLTKTLVTRSKILALKLNYVLQNDEEIMIDEMSCDIMNEVITKKDKSKMLMIIFQYYMLKFSKDKLTDFMPKLKQNLSSIEYHECKMAFDINLNGSYAYISELKEGMDIADEHEKGMKAFMIAKQYENMNDQKSRGVYLQKALYSLKGTPFEAVIKNELCK